MKSKTTWILRSFLPLDDVLHKTLLTSSVLLITLYNVYNTCHVRYMIYLIAYGGGATPGRSRGGDMGQSQQLR